MYKTYYNFLSCYPFQISKETKDMPFQKDSTSKDQITIHSMSNPITNARSRKTLYKELGLEDSNSCGGFDALECVSTLSKPKSNGTNLESSAGLLLSDSSDDECETNEKAFA